MTVTCETLQYPRLVYRPSVPPDWVYLKVYSPSECERAVSDGWSLTPIILGSTDTITPSVSADPVRPKPRGWPKGAKTEVDP
jgi:hypothetical protein